MDQPVRFPLVGHITPRSRWTYVLTMPCFAILFSYLLVGDGYWQNGWTFISATLLNSGLLTATFFTQGKVAEVITRRYPRFEQTLRRVSLTLLAHTVLSALFLGIIAGLYIQLRLFGSSIAYATLLKAYAINLVFIVLSVGIYETFYSLNQWQQIQINKEKLKKENLKGQLQGLKSQVNPHFLFNSLNSLSSLIADEPQRAELFVDQMARVYRYMLQTNRQSTIALSDNSTDDELTTLETELTFIDSYYHLLKTRHGTGLHLDVRVGSQYLHYRLPPLTLQLLVENAVKHNVILASKPLHIEIETLEQGQLRIRNNLQKKTKRADLSRTASSWAKPEFVSELESTHVGLANIKAKYHLLEQPEPVIEPGPDYFTVTLPLLTKSSTNS